MNEEPIIEVKGLWKRYGLPPLLPWKKQAKGGEWALRDINFSIPRGGSLGILGRNGAGKSTLLKLLAGVTPPDKGSIAVRGKVFPIIELTAGMGLELSGRENIRVLGTIMGLTSSEISNIIPKVEDFSELGKWISRPVWQYSSGMVARLAFSIAVYMQADILIVDEVLGVGDILFQRKCQQRVQEILENGTTLLFVSHNPHQVELLCQDAMLLSKGHCISYGDSVSVSKKYLAQTYNKKEISKSADLRSTMDIRDGSGDVRVTNVELRNAENGAVISSAISNKPLIIRTYCELKKKIKIFNFFIRIANSDDQVIFSAMTTVDFSSKQIGEECFIDCNFDKFAIYGEMFYINIKISDGILIDNVHRAIIFSSLLPDSDAKNAITNGCFLMDHSWG